MQPYTVITMGRSGNTQHIVADFENDEDAIRWAHYYLGLDQAISARLYRGHHRDKLPRAGSFVEIEAPEGCLSRAALF